MYCLALMDNVALSNALYPLCKKVNFINWLYSLKKSVLLVTLIEHCYFCCKKKETDIVRHLKKSIHKEKAAVKQ